MRILHLGFEDHLRPGSGGGSHRSHEINRRLAAQGHDVEVVTAAFLQAQPRIEDGVRYRHIGDGGGYLRSIVTYHARLAPLVARVRLSSQRPDVVVEEFAPPFSTLGLGALAGVPSVGNVQGYFAEQKAAEYGVPVPMLTAVERWGTRRHRHLVALSDDLAAKLRDIAPRSRIVVNGMGVPHDEIARALTPAPPTIPGRIVFLGRLEVAQKGLDLLLDALRSVSQVPGLHLVLAGDGRDRRAVEDLVRRLDLSSRVSLVGRVTGAEKWRLLASAQVTVMPSRYETFGLSALESLACATPVLAFDIPCLRETVPVDAGRLIQPFDVAALTGAMGEMASDLELCQRLGRSGRDHASAYNWDAITASQLAVYDAAVAAYEERRRGPSGTPH